MNWTSLLIVRHHYLAIDFGRARFNVWPIALSFAVRRGMLRRCHDIANRPRTMESRLSTGNSCWGQNWLFRWLWRSIVIVYTHKMELFPIINITYGQYILRTEGHALDKNIMYKLCVLMHSIHTGRSLRYLSEIVQSVASRTTRSGLRSAESNDYITPRLNTKFGERSFSHAGPASWNSLPADLRSISDCSCFKSKLKTYLLQLAFNIQ